MKRSKVLYLLVLLLLLVACKEKSVTEQLEEAKAAALQQSPAPSSNEEEPAGVKGRDDLNFDQLIANIQGQTSPYDGAYYYVQPQNLPEYERCNIRVTEGYIRYEFIFLGEDGPYRIGFMHHKSATMESGPLANPKMVEGDERFYEMDGFIIEDSSRVGEANERIFVYWEQDGIHLSAALPADSSEGDIRHLSKVEIIAVQGIEPAKEDASGNDPLKDENWVVNGNSIYIIVDGVTEPEIVDSNQNVILRQGEELYRMIDGSRIRAGTVWRIGDHRTQYVLAPDSYVVRMEVLRQGATIRPEVLVMAFKEWKYTMMTRYMEINPADHLLLLIDPESATLIEEVTQKEITASSIAGEEELDKMNKDRAQ